MDEDGEWEKWRHRVDYNKVPPWSVTSHFQMKDQNAFHATANISMLFDERDAAITEREHAIAEKKAALLERDAAIQQRDAAIAERDNALKERDNAVAALRFALLGSVAHGVPRTNCPTDQNAKFAHTVVPSDSAKPERTRTRLNKNYTPKRTKSSNNRRVTTCGTKTEWDAQEIGSDNLVHFDEFSMAGPVCSCTGVPRQCYKWGNGGWQSSCCTMTLSVYPLPQIPNKKHSRIGGRKMSGTVFSRLLTRVAAAGHDLSIPVDLKNYWAKHGTNRYITIM